MSSIHTHQPRSACPKPDAISNSGATEERIRHLSKILRVVGTLTFLSATASFLVQRWGVSNDIERYLSLLGVTTLLPVAGLICGMGLRETKSARTLLGALLSILPIHFGVLGGLVYAHFAVDASESLVPRYLLWQGGTRLTVLVTLLGAVCLLTILTAFAHAIFARVHAKRLTFLAILLNSLLLIPVRTSWVSACIAFAAAGALVLYDQRSSNSVPELRTLESRWARAMLFVPLLLMVARAIYLYPIDASFGAWTLGGLSMCALILSMNPGDHRRIPAYTSAFGLVGAAGFAATSLASVIPAWASLATCGLTTSAALALFAQLNFVSRPVSVSMTIVVAWISTLGASLLGGGPPAFALCLAVGLASAGYGYTTRRNLVMGIGLVQVLGSLLALWRSAVNHYGFNTWGALAAVGVLTVMATALLERWLQSPARQRAKRVENI